MKFYYKYIITIIFTITLLYSQNFSALNSSLTKKQKDMIKQAKSLESSGLIKEASLAYQNILSTFPDLKEAYLPLKKIYLNNENLTELLSISDKYLKANLKNIKNRIVAIDVYIILDNPKWEEIMNEALNVKPFNLSNIKKIVSILLQNNKESTANNLIAEIRDKTKQTTFYSLEKGMYYALKMDIKNAINEYLLYLKKQPKNIKIITQRIMLLTDNESAISIIKEELEKSDLKESKIILSELEFKLKNYEKAYMIIDGLQKNESQKLALVRDLLKIENYELIQKILTDLLDKSTNPKIMEKAIYYLAVIYEMQSKDLNSLPISSKIFQNELLESPFTKLNSEHSDLLYKAINIYDSLSTHKKDFKSKLHLADIKYKINGDLDGAKKIYEEIYKHYPQLEYKQKALSNIIEIDLAKGNINKAISTIDSLNIPDFPDELKIVLDIKKIQTSFYTLNRDTLILNSQNILKSIKKNNNLYNDILSILSLFSFYKDDDLKQYIDAKFKVVQNKRTQAIKILNSITPDNKIFALARLEAAYLEVLHENYNQALVTINEIESEKSNYNEEIMILKGEIYDYGLNDISQAVDIYLAFLDLFPESIYYDLIRLRLRKLAL